LANNILITGGQVVDPARGIDAMGNVSIHGQPFGQDALLFGN
jgi:predicted amidohydrolase